MSDEQAQRTPDQIPTPRTDAAAFDYEDGEGECVTAEFARQLERRIVELEAAAAIHKPTTCGIKGCTLPIGHQGFCNFDQVK